jgi:acetyl esterase/lipase
VYPADAAAARPTPGLVWAHGGGFAAGDLDMPEADWVARSLAARGVTVVSVDYRLVGDGCRYPAPSDDVLAAWRWTLAHADELGLDRDRLAIGGASAGANLVAGAVLRLLRPADRGAAGPRIATHAAGRVASASDPAGRVASAGERIETHPAGRVASASERIETSAPGLDTGAARPTRPAEGAGAARPARPAEAPAGVFLAYPTLLAVQPAPDAALRALLDANPDADRFGPDRVRSMYEAYLGGPVDDAPLPAVPGRAAASDVVGFPPVLMINGEADELRVSGEVFAATLVEAGVPLELSTEAGTEHGHLNRPDGPAASASIERVVRWIDGLSGLDTGAERPTRPAGAGAERPTRPAGAGAERPTRPATSDHLTTLRTNEGIPS